MFVFCPAGCVNIGRSNTRRAAVVEELIRYTYRYYNLYSRHGLLFISTAPYILVFFT